jgi:hypothetical protein
MNMRIRLLLGLLLLPVAAFAHVGSPDVYFDGHAGPYHVLVTVRPSPVVPGVAEISVRSAANDINEIKIRPLRLVGPGANLAPKPDLAQRSADDPQLFTGQLWIMDRGSWQVQVQIDGQHGPAELGVPVPAVSSYSVKMQKTLGGMLSVLGLVLVAGLIGIVGAANRDARLNPGETPTSQQNRRGYIGMAVAAVLVVAALLGANTWWGDEASANEKLAYKLPQADVSLNGSKLQLRLQNPNEEAGFFGSGKNRMERVDRLRLDDLVPDHGHLLHLFLVSMPDMKSFWHLHPDQEETAVFNQDLPNLPPGHYQVYADIVHSTGFPETEVAELNVPGMISGKPASKDDSGGPDFAAAEKIAQLSDGYRMVWERDPATLRSKRPIWFRFRVEDRDGKPAQNLEPYMGMAGHAVFIKSDGKVFAHVHPAGSVAMAAVDLAGGTKQSAMADMPGMNAPANGEVSFPYGFPQAGDYHIFVQVKRAGKVETGDFLARVEN